MRHSFFSLLLLLCFGTIQAQGTCIVDFDAHPDGCTVSFSATVQTGGQALSYEWDFGDGQRAYDSSPSNNYSNNGTYNVELIVTTSDSCVETISKVVEVTDCMVCQANFAWSDQDCYVGFSDFSLSYAEINSWSWHFGDGNSSTEQSPSHSYADSGTYFVELTIGTLDNCTSTYTETITIASCSTQTECTADFSYSENICELSFSDNSFSNNGNLDTWYWDFGDSNYSLDQSPTHHYGSDGDYTVSLTVSSADGCSDTKTELITVSTCSTYTDCSADFSYFDNSCEISFSDYSYSNYGSIDTWYWDFGDGGSSLDQSPTHHYGADGNYSISLTISSADGCSDTKTELITVSSCSTYTDCTADFSYYENSCELSFNDNSYNSNGSVDTWYWDFGDGGFSSDQSPTHHYGADGNYSISLTISSADGCSDTKTELITVSTCSTYTDCTADFSYYENYCEVSFSDNSYSNYGSIDTWQWDFGDGNFSSDQSPTHHYGADGDYTISLTISSADGCSDTKTELITVSTCSTYTDCTADFSYYENSCELSFNDNSYNSNGSVDTWYWDFGDGGFSSDQSPTHHYGADGDYTISLTISSADGCSDTKSELITVSTCSTYTDCTADFSYYENSCELSFNDNSYNSNGSVDTWYWDFGDGGFSSDQSPTHHYGADGDYTISLTISSADGCSDTKSELITVSTCSTYTDCTADFSYYENYCEVSFSDNSYSNYGSIDTWQWDFGDGDFSSDQSPTHHYGSAGNFTVSLTISGADSCYDVKTETIYIDSCYSFCEANFTYYNSSPCTMAFGDLTNTDRPIVSWHWDFGDGNTSAAQNPIHTFAQGGTYDVTLKIVTEDSCYDEIVQSVLVDNCYDYCEAEFYHQQDAQCNVYFNDQSQTESTIIAWYWEFGDGNTSWEQNPVHYYGNQQGRDYNTSLTIWTEDSCRSTSIQTIYVDYCGAYCEAKFEYFFESDCKVAFNDYSTSSFQVSGWKWTFGDGHSSTAQNPEHTFGANGIYAVKLVITTDDNCTDSLTQNIEVTNCTPDCHAAFQHTVSNSLAYFKDRSLSQDKIVFWHWEFGDGTASPEANPVHHFQDPGTYQVILKIRTEDECTDEIKKYITISGCGVACKADFAFSSDQACVFSFQDYSNSYYDIISWDWDFGDGNTSGEQHPEHIFSADGTYDVRLVIQTSDGCGDTIQHPMTVVNCGKAEERAAPKGGQTSDLSDYEATDLTTSLGEQLIKDKVQFYPNPTKDIVSIAAKFVEPTALTWEVVDLRGQTILKVSQDQASLSLDTEIDLSSLSAGVYLIYLRNEDGLLHRSKIIKQN